MLKKILIAVPVIIILLIALRLITIGISQKNEFKFHRNIPKTIRLWSDDFKNSETIPIRFSGWGENASPSLSWDNLPENTQSVAILVEDYDAPSPYFKMNTIDHWVLFNISSEINHIDKAITTEQLQAKGIMIGKNIESKTAYIGPMPPFGKHHYYFRIYALSIPKVELIEPTKTELMDIIGDHILAYGELVGTYKK